MRGFADTAAKFVEPINKLIDSVSGAIGKVYEPRHIRKTADAEAYKIQKISDTIRENSDIPIVYSPEGVSLSTTDYEKLIKRTQHRMAFQELKKQENIESVADKAYGLLEGELPVTDEPVEEDWMLRFFNCVEDISNEKMQELWACLLAGEIKKPGTFSLRTLERLRNLTQSEAESFQSLCKHCLRFADDLFVLNEIVYQTAFKVPTSLVLTLADCGLVVADSDISYQAQLENGSNLVFYTNNYAFVVDSGISKDWAYIPIFPLTSSGIELANLISHSMTLSEFQSVIISIKEKFKGKALHIYPIKSIDGTTVHYDNTVELIDENNC